VGGELEDGALAVGTGGDDADVGRVLDGDDDAGGQDNLLPVDRCEKLVSFLSLVSIAFEVPFFSKLPHKVSSSSFFRC
jgi:hypothetical protein